MASILASCQGGSSQHIQPPTPPEDDVIYKTEELKGKPIPAWEEGMLDIHFINTTAGESYLVIFPDATQLLVDAAGSGVGTGVVGNTTNVEIRKRWDPTKSNMLYGEFIADYVKKCMAWTGNNKIDYLLLTHLHNDHFGEASGLPKSKLGGNYTQQSFPYLMDEFPVGLLLDRDYPDYGYPYDNLTLAANKGNIANYVNAVKWHVTNKSLKVEKFKAGVNDQIKLLKNPSKYASCEVRNIAVNGEIWTGAGNATNKTFPSVEEMVYADPTSIKAADKCPPENHNSIVFKIRYGRFDYFGGGDMQYNGASSFSWKNVETNVAKVAGVVDVMKADHHGVDNTNGTDDSKGYNAMKYLNPRVWIVNSWTDGHPRPATLTSVLDYCPSMDVFITNFSTSTQTTVGEKYTKSVKGYDGHVVVRVVDGGAKYYIFVLNDSDRTMNVQKVVGPYTSK